MRRLFTLTLLPLLLFGAWPCFAQNQDYLPLSRAETADLVRDLVGEAVPAALSGAARRDATTSLPLQADAPGRHLVRHLSAPLPTALALSVVAGVLDAFGALERFLERGRVEVALIH